MYWKYVIKRVINGIIIYIILIFIFSALFNMQMEQTVRAMIDEKVKGEVMAQSTSGKWTPEQLMHWSKDRKTYYYELYNLNKPVFERIVSRTVDTLLFRYGKSTIIKSSFGERDVVKIIFETVPRTLLLFGTAAIIDVLLGTLIGIKKAQKPGKPFDKGTSIATMVVYGMPSWWLGMLMIMFFVYIVKVFPSGGMHSTPPPTGFMYHLDTLWHLTLPVLTLVIIGFWGRAFLIRNIVLGVLQDDYIMSARARGLPERKVLFGHALRTAAPPLITMALLSLLVSVSGGILFESIFSWSGMGNLYWISVEQSDIPVLMGDLSFTTGLYICGLVILDLIYGFLDPRIKVSGKA